MNPLVRFLAGISFVLLLSSCGAQDSCSCEKKMQCAKIMIPPVDLEVEMKKGLEQLRSCVAENFDIQLQLDPWSRGPFWFMNIVAAQVPEDADPGYNITKTCMMEKMGLVKDGQFNVEKMKAYMSHIDEKVRNEIGSSCEMPTDFLNEEECKQFRNCALSACASVL